MMCYTKGFFFCFFVFSFTQNDQSLEPNALSLLIAEATLANTCNGIITDIIFFSLEDKNGLINIHPDAKRTIISKLRIPFMLIYFVSRS